MPVNSCRARLYHGEQLSSVVWLQRLPGPPKLPCSGLGLRRERTGGGVETLDRHTAGTGEASLGSVDEKEMELQITISLHSLWATQSI